MDVKAIFVSCLMVPAKPTLRLWEKELDGIIVFHRTRGGQRRYALELLAARVAEVVRAEVHRFFEGGRD